MEVDLKKSKDYVINLMTELTKSHPSLKDEIDELDREEVKSI